MSLLSWRVSRLLQRLKRAVGAPRSRQVGKRAANELAAARVKLKQANLEALDRLRRAALRRCSTSFSQRKKVASAKCPWCGGGGARLLVTLDQGVVLRCPGCGEVWTEEGPQAG